MKNKTFSIVLISCLGILAYSNTFLCAFHFDDGPSIIDNLAIRNIHHLAAIWNVWPCRFMTFFSFAVNYHFDHLNVFGYHLFNLGVHLVTSILVWWLVYLTFLTPVMKDSPMAPQAHLISLLAGLIFVSHPIQTQAVTFIWQRAASMAALFYLASLCFYIKSRIFCHPGPEGRRILKHNYYYFGSLIAAILAMFTKETAITLPLMVALYEFSFLQKERSFNFKGLLPFLFIFLLIPITWVISGSGKILAVRFATNHTSMQYLLTEFRVLVTYIRLLFLPLHQNLDYDYPLYKNFFELPVIFSFTFLAIIFVFALRMFSKYRLISFAIFWFFLTVLPESSFFPFADVIFEHRLYLPLVGYSLFLVAGAYYLVGNSSIKMMVMVLTLIVAVNAILTYQRNKFWKDEISLWSDVVEKSPHKARGFNNLGLAYIKEGDLAHAIDDYTMAIKINPQYAQGYYNRGTSYAKQNNLTKALSDYNKAIEIDPHYGHAYNNRGFIYSIQGKFPQALSDFNKAIEINPDYADAYNNRAYLLSVKRAR